MRTEPAAPILRRMPHRLGTDEVEARCRTAYWADAACDTCVQLERRCARRRRGDRRRDRRRPAGDARTLARQPTVQHVRRTPAKIASTSEDFFLVSIQTEGRGVNSQDGREAVSGPGDVALYDSTRPYQLTFDSPFQQYVLMLPGPTLRTAVRDSERLTASTVCGGRGAGHLMVGISAPWRPRSRANCACHRAPCTAPGRAKPVRSATGSWPSGWTRCAAWARLHSRGASTMPRISAAPCLRAPAACRGRCGAIERVKLV